MAVKEDDVAWVEAEKDYAVGLADGKLVCRNPKGKTLASVPKWLKESETGESLKALAEWLSDHELECQHTVERWMLGSLVIPRDVLSEVWPDPAWQLALRDMVIAPANAAGKVDYEKTGLLRDVDAKRGMGVIDLDGETQWHRAASFTVPHPILIADLDELRELAGDLSIRQVVDQLYRPVAQPTAEQKVLKQINDYAGGKFEQLNFALSVCRRLGYPVRGGYATCRVFENGQSVQARYYVGDEYPESETWTGALVFVDESEHAIAIGDLGAVTFSEGVRMASAIYAKRKVEDDSEAAS
ncbi:DUF4132 domain-containing protein [Rhodopirellula sp. MGV]|uniref:DUF4132 domain-containing protein n=1 Tax=Rhodopirellula sp. MGV TaxID=2023130 RepID=UPI000B976412|nr:DUF4132 domain-containing protein [Rhodopirellula sp. MGV]OYP33072.1 hypothetical protein CGZ80_18450 [Rhodopirellula sp. MGV]PNY37975.1 DUF4132 domain-containing protein [Rhodopirellula baltica]